MDSTLENKSILWMQTPNPSTNNVKMWTTRTPLRAISLAISYSVLSENTPMKEFVWFDSEKTYDEWVTVGKEYLEKCNAKMKYDVAIFEKSGVLVSYTFEAFKHFFGHEIIGDLNKPSNVAI